jgi:hypothetical protein
MTIVQCIPQWLRNSWQKAAPQKPMTVAKKDRQVLPTLPKPKRPPTLWQDDAGEARFRIYWRM